jgi:hypothetical protein
LPGRQRELPVSIRKRYRAAGADYVALERDRQELGKGKWFSMELATISVVWIAVIAVVLLFLVWMAVGRLIRRRTDELK